MSDEMNGKTEKPDPKSSPKSTQIAVRLVPSNDSDQPVLANYVSLQPASGMLLLDFGFLEPAVLAALPNVARRGGKLPESLNGRLAVRVAMGYESAVAEPTDEAHGADEPSGAGGETGTEQGNT